MEIPIVDISKCSVSARNVEEKEMEILGEQIYRAFSTVGFVYLKNSGITSAQVDRVHGVMDKFFLLEEDIKKKFARDSENYGYIGISVESINPERPGDFKEAFNVTGNALEDSTTLWPDDHIPEFSNEMRSFCDVCGQFSKRLLQVLSSGMKMENKEYFLRCHSRINKKDNFTTLRALHYPPIPDDVHLSPGQIRLGEHCDYGSFTLLFQDQVGGLQVQSYDGEYFEAPPIPETILVNIGDILQFWTKGRLKSTRHRVLIPEEESQRKLVRRSLAYFVHPDHEVRLSEVEYGASSMVHHELMKAEYQTPVTAFEHVNQRFQKTYN